MSFNTEGLVPSTVSWTKDEILQYVTPEMVFVKLGIPAMDEDRGGRFLSPFREDSHPDCKLVLTKESGELRYYDPSEGLFLDWLGTIMYATNCTFPKALDWVVEQFGLVKGQEVSPEVKHYQQLAVERKKVVRYPTTIAVRTVNMSKKDLDWWAQFNISKDMLFQNRVWAISDYWLDGRHSYIPKGMLAFAYKEDDGYKLYFPEGDKRNKWLSSTKALACYDTLPQTGDLLLITSSKKDAMCLKSFGYHAIAPQGEGVSLPNHILWELKQRFKKVILFYDNDAPGVKAATKAVKEWQVDGFVHTPPTEPKDPAAYCKEYGPEKTQQFLTTILSCA
jgi:hypothetical protein